MRKAKLAGADGDTEINISPLIDMVFILLIFFIVTTVFVEEEGLAIETPTADQLPPTERVEPFVLTVSEGGAVFHDGREIGLRGIAGSIQNARSMGTLKSVTIEVHRRASMASAASVLDFCTEANVPKLVMKALPDAD